MVNEDMLNQDVIYYDRQCNNNIKLKLIKVHSIKAKSMSTMCMRGESKSLSGKHFTNYIEILYENKHN